MRKDNGDPNWAYWEDRKANKEFSFHFSHGGRILMTSDNKEILLAMKIVYRIHISNRKFSRMFRSLIKR